jgi:[protein-PII] uridylyltransferase
VVKRRYEAALEEARAAFLATGDAAALLTACTGAAERLVEEAWREHFTGEAERALCLAAVGGFGRRERFPYSDVDLLVLAREPGAHAGPLAAFLARLWDEGLRPSHSVRRPAECAQFDSGNFELSISLLDRRYLAGDRSLYEELGERLKRFLRAGRLEVARALCRAARERHARFEGAVQHLEPDVKEAPGGLRDLQLVRWLEQLAEPPAAAAAGSASSELGPASSLLAQLRAFLHLRAGRDENRFSFEAQEDLAAQPFSSGRSIAGWMRDYFLCARRVHQAALLALERWEAASSPLWVQFRDWRSRAGTSEFTASRGRVWLRAPVLQPGDWGLVLRLFEFLARHDLPPSADTQRRIAEWTGRLGSPREWNLALWPPLERILRSPHASRALRAMHETGLLGAIFAEWRQVECLVLRDFSHRYTVDEHTLVSLEKLEELSRRADPVGRRLAALAAETENPAVLRCALLFHDVGKVRSECEHTAESARMAEAALARIGAPEATRRHVVRLILRHGDLSEFMRRRDPDDPAAAREMAERVETLEGLRELAVLTYADISAVHPAAMTPWRLELLWRAYRAVAEALTRELDAARIEREEARSAEAAAFLEGLPKRYLHTHDEAAIEADLLLARRAAKRGAAVEIERHDGYYAMRLAARDRPFLLASIAGALAASGMTILKLEAYANRQGMVLDTFIFEDLDRSLELNPGELERLRRLVERAALGRVDVARLVAERPKWRAARRRVPVAPMVRLDNDASPASTLVEVVAEDRPGLLYELAMAISGSGCNIEVALLDTQAHQALDIFYVTRQGAKLDPAAETALREALLAVCRRER